jgi:uncharacterized protein
MAEDSNGAGRRVRLAAVLLIAALAAGPIGTHVYWMLGGTWGLYTRGVRDEVATTGTRFVAAIVVVLLIVAVLVVLARVGLWRQALVPDRLIRLSAWALAAVFLAETLAAFTWSRGEELWWMYGAVSLAIALLALVVASPGGVWASLPPDASDTPHSLEETQDGGIEMDRFSGKYLSLTSFKRNGTGVATPVWFVSDNGHLLVETDADSYKVKRIRRDGHVRVAVCDARGRVRGEPVDADARILPDDERERVERLLAHKYRIDRWTVYPLYRLALRLRGQASRTHEPPVALEISVRGRP